ncbi:MAG: flagellar export protein FliJ [Syntrophomonadaceae bacterium]|nr:flagellar export protein FliJ [Syntrophomonadaceae bacterium]
MQKFKFRLQTSLKVALKREDMQRIELHRCHTAYQEALDDLKQLQQQFATQEEELRKIQLKQPQVEMMRLYRNFMLVLHLRIQEQSHQVKHLFSELTSCRLKLQALMQERKVLEKLEQRRWREYQQEVLREEQKFIDELALRGYGVKEATK